MECGEGKAALNKGFIWLLGSRCRCCLPALDNKNIQIIRVAKLLKACRILRHSKQKSLRWHKSF